ncbi:6-phosphogluconate dehydrogenase, decarboxylating [Planoprotostelium fungivorum]|uniref:phosphogluconate dehydrogenase (NADP(+)-dependent, decarboxylating) n=1 Tax=Planoprotostelium fungivorum TaxID=1890364 RepID=A0A2P6NI83_9EUKA|nr:6-phosphogluconate dehydrogenase, decarboxylating [Planoprotostelium fungivorum]
MAEFSYDNAILKKAILEMQDVRSDKTCHLTQVKKERVMTQEMDHIGIIGAGSMGLNMSLLFADHDIRVSVFDVSGKNIDQLHDLLESDEKQRKFVTGYKELKDFMNSFKGEKTLLLSLTHGKPVDEVLSKLREYLKKGDTIIDGGNEWYLETERRQKEMKDIGVGYIGTGVSGGYQSARRGPSLSPGGDRVAYDKVKHLLEKIAARDGDAPCVDYVGVGGSGHYVKMVHNGIEQGMLSITSEAHEIMKSVLGFSHERIARTFTEWNSHGPLRNNFLVRICGEIAARKDDKDKFIVDVIEDRVVQDSDASEGTGVWTVKEAGERHVPCPTITSAHFLRTASAHRDDREKIHEQWKKIRDEPKQTIEAPERIVELLESAVHAGFLASFIQGMNLVAQASIDFGWKLHLPTILKVWRNGCIIEAEYINQVLSEAFADQSKGSEPLRHVATSPRIAQEINDSYSALRRIVLIALHQDAHVPALSASLEYFKYEASLHLPTAFMEAQLDYFGGHSYDLVSEDNLKIEKGHHHTEWKKP